MNRNESKLLKLMFDFFKDLINYADIRGVDAEKDSWDDDSSCLTFTKEYLKFLEENAKEFATPYHEMFHAWERDVRNTYGKDKGKYLTANERVAMYRTFNYYFDCFK